MSEAALARNGRDLRDTALGDAELDARLARTWGTTASLIGRLSTVDHKIVGRRYLLTALAFLLLGGALAAVMRMQLARPESQLVGPDLYNQLFTMHGTTMMFLFGVPVAEAFAVYLVPLMVGTRNIAFPRLNAFSYWMYLFGGIFLWCAFALNIGPDVGWFAYVPLAGPQYGIGKRPDVWAQMITFTEVSGMAVAIEIIVTAFKQRAPGMTLDRIPLFVWAMIVTSFCIVFAMPAVMLSSTSLILDRLVGTHFYNAAEGGDALLYQHLFWFFGHPEVYIIFLPATGMVSAIVVTFARRPAFGYLPLVLSLIAVGFLSFGLWVHHMFATGLPQLGASFFTANSMLIAIPNGRADLLLDRDAVERAAAVPNAAVLRPRILLHLRHRRPVRHHAGLGADRPAGARHLLRRRPLPLRADRRRGVPAHRRDLLLVPEVQRPDDERTARPLAFLARLHRLQPRLLPDAHPRAAGHAAPRLHLSARDGLGQPEPPRHGRRRDPGAELRAVRLEL